jgi:hypothetical protein
MSRILAALILCLPVLAHAEAIGELTNLAGPMPDAARPAAVTGVQIKASVSKRPCPADWEAKRIGDCWTTISLFEGEENVRAYVHPAGYVVDPRCLSDKRFPAQDILDALTTAGRKMDPGISSQAGGCMGTYNPEWGGELKDQVWKNRMYVQCPQNYDQNSLTCADEADRDAYIHDAQGNMRREEKYYRMISLRNVMLCTGKGTTGLGGTLFHESLHAAGADNMPLEVHNQAWGDRKQYEFIRDRVYGTEDVCFLGKEANIVQCRNAVAYNSDAPRYDLCKGFSAVFTDMPPGTIK